MRARLGNQIIAESDDIVMVEGNAYFPRASLKEAFFTPSDHTSKCFWKGTAHYLNVVVHGQSESDAAWYYPEPLPAAAQIRGRVAFWKGVVVEP